MATGKKSSRKNEKLACFRLKRHEVAVQRYGIWFFMFSPAGRGKHGFTCFPGGVLCAIRGFAPGGLTGGLRGTEDRKRRSPDAGERAVRKICGRFRRLLRGVPLTFYVFALN